jgi:hypothetical protein
MSNAGWKTMAGLLVLIAFTGAVEACHSPTAPEATITGTVHFYALEGGFWAVQGDDGKTYDPMNTLPSAFQHEDLHVQIVFRVKSDAPSIHMVGSVVDILQIRPL